MLAALAIGCAGAAVAWVVRSRLMLAALAFGLVACELPPPPRPVTSYTITQFGAPPLVASGGNLHIHRSGDCVLVVDHTGPGSSWRELARACGTFSIVETR